jgi:hypothetical protein
MQSKLHPPLLSLARRLALRPQPRLAAAQTLTMSAVLSAVCWALAAPTVSAQTKMGEGNQIVSDSKTGLAWRFFTNT